MNRLSKAMAGVVLFVFFLVSQTVQAKTFTGRVTEVNPDSKSMTVYSTSENTSEQFSLSLRSLKITLDGKTVKPEDVAVGDLVTIFSSTSNTATRIMLKKSGSNSDTSTPTPVMKNEPTDPGNLRAVKTSAHPWPGFLGNDRSNRSGETGLLSSWPSNGPQLQWVARNLGEGYSSVSIAEGKVFCLGTRVGQEYVFAFDLKTGQELWSTPNGSIFNDGQGNGPRSTPSYSEGKIYSLGASGDLSCLQSASGQHVWSKNILTEYGASNIVWGISESPLIDGNHCVVTPGGSQATMVALNKENGNLIWYTALPGSPQAGYASAIAAEINGTAQYVNFCHIGLFGVDAKTGQPLWGDNNAANNTANCSCAVDTGSNTLFYASGYGTGGAFLKFAARQGKPALGYKTEKMKNHHGGMVEWNGHIYGANENILTCLKAATGTVAWQDRLGGNGKGAITFADGHLYFRSENGPMYLIEANPNELKIKGEFEQPERSGRPSWARPVVADGKLFLRDQDILLCYQIKP